MNRSKSVPIDLKYYDKVQPLRKSKSDHDLTDNKFYFEETFEGDGALGILFNEINGNVVINGINDLTVASETYGLELGMILISIEYKSIEGVSFKKVMNTIGAKWKKDNNVTLLFRLNLNYELYKSLNSIGYLLYYDDFIELGVAEDSDYEYVEYSDLVKMKIPLSKRQDFHKLNKKINPEVYDFCKRMNCKEYYSRIIDMGIERIVDFELIEYNDLIDIDMDDHTIKRFTERFKKINYPLNLYLSSTLSEDEKRTELEKYKGIQIVLHDITTPNA
jgi:hypothetical protein